MPPKKRYPDSERAYKQKHKARANEQRKVRRQALAATPEGREHLRVRGYAAQLKHNYGLSIEQRDALLASQGGQCAIRGCVRPMAFGGKGGAVVDHCHETGRVRGVLCATCNKGLGQLGDTEDRLRAALEYLLHSNV